MLQCTWKGGNPYFVFSLDKQREVYVANTWKEGSNRGNCPDCMFLIHSRKGSHKEHGISDNESNLLGKMKIQTSSHNHRKNKGLQEKVVEAFKSSHSSKPRLRSSTSIMEDSSRGPCQDIDNNSASFDTTNNSAEELPPNLELIAIVVRNHLPKSAPCRGLGLKVSPEVVKQHVETVEASVQCACSLNTGDCSTSMDILVPAGIHGGPRTINGVPSSLIDRWRSGEHCDCGGWDLGCPLTLLKSRSSKETSLPSTYTLDAGKLFDFSVQGSKNGSPKLRIANVHDGLYYIHFQSTLSAPRSFSIAVAYIHARSPDFRPKNVKPSR
ncbi:U-box domain-containing protein 72-like [Hibiscus syriacus]|uniref:U-box domain-containing protein 72-like n=1 Tax=Hibiscus syriacus TaxID=106335 RepID=A0A6A2YKF4_HIBSY|nr:U-box domain-containing protein 72-like [Hibiscus syriacus]